MTKPFKVGDRVTWCGVEGVVVLGEHKNYPARVEFDESFENFTEDGKFLDWHKEPSLFHVDTIRDQKNDDIISDHDSGAHVEDKVDVKEALNKVIKDLIDMPKDEYEKLVEKHNPERFECDVEWCTFTDDLKTEITYPIDNSSDGLVMREFFKLSGKRGKLIFIPENAPNSIISEHKDAVCGPKKPTRKVEHWEHVWFGIDGDIRIIHTSETWDEFIGVLSKRASIIKNHLRSTLIEEFLIDE